MNVYQMYYANEKKFGFFIKRNYWGRLIAKVISIEGVIEGEEIPGKKPYHNNPIVIGEFYIEYEKKWCLSENLDNISEISCPGNYSYHML